MANKEIYELTRINKFSYNDLITVFDASVSGSRGQKIKKIRMEEVSIPTFDDGIVSAFGRLRIVTHYKTFLTFGYNETVRVSAYDVIVSVHNAVGNVTYGLSKNNVDWTESTDPFSCYLEYDCDEFNSNSTPTIYVRVSDTVETLPGTISTLDLIDPNSHCGGGGP